MRKNGGKAEKSFFILNITISNKNNAGLCWNWYCISSFQHWAV